MLTFETYKQFLRACTGTEQCYRKPAGPYLWTCETCGKTAPHTEDYGTCRDTQSMHCYGCCHLSDVAQLLDRSKPFVAYLSDNGRTITNWPGGVLGFVETYAESPSGWHGSTIARFTMRDVHGAYWSGRGAGRGMICTLRAMKGPRK